MHSFAIPSLPAFLMISSFTTMPFSDFDPAAITAEKDAVSRFYDIVRPF